MGLQLWRCEYSILCNGGNQLSVTGAESHVMTDRTVSGGKGVHTGGYVADLDPSGVTETSEVDITYRHNPPIGDYGIVAQRGQDVQLKHPVEEVEELYHEGHLCVQFGEMNRPSDDEGEEDHSEERFGEAVAKLDEAVLAVAERALRAEDVALDENPEDETLDELPGKPQQVRALLLHDAWAMDSYLQLVEHLKETEAIP